MREFIREIIGEFVHFGFHIYDEYLFLSSLILLGLLFYLIKFSLPKVQKIDKNNLYSSYQMLGLTVAFIAISFMALLVEIFRILVNF